MEILTADNLVALLTLTFLEIVLGIDNIIFISIVTNKLEEKKRPMARNLGLILALTFRVFLLFGISIIVKFTEPVFTLFEHGFSARDLILLAGGCFLLVKSTSEIHHKVTAAGNREKQEEEKEGKSFWGTILQIVVLDLVFSFDSILTAIGLSDKLWLMVTAVILSMFVMLAFAKAISDFINRHPTLQILALSFLILIGVMLGLESVHIEVPKGYIYFAVFFSLLVEFVNISIAKRKKRKA